jgi:hypothetical protein
VEYPITEQDLVARFCGMRDLGMLDIIARVWGRTLPASYGPEVTNGPFLSHKGTERERRCAGVAEFRRERRLSLRTALTGNRCFPIGRATTLQIARNWQPIVSLGHHASPVPPMSAYVSNLSVPLLLAISAKRAILDKSSGNPNSVEMRSSDRGGSLSAAHIA